MTQRTDTEGALVDEQRGHTLSTVWRGTQLMGRRSGRLTSLAAIALGLLLWQLYAMGQPAYLFPDLGRIAGAFAEQIQEYGLAFAFLRSLATLLVGYVLACAVGVGIGVAMGLDVRIDAVLGPYVNALYVAPVAALTPIIILVGGVNFWSRVFVVFLFAVFEIAIDTYQGIRTTPAGMLDVARSFQAGRRFLIQKVMIPHSLPYVFAGLRLGIAQAVKGVVVAELLVEFTNMGRILHLWQENFRVAGVLSIVLLLMALGIVLTRLIQLIEAKALRWRREVKV